MKESIEYETSIKDTASRAHGSHGLRTGRAVLPLLASMGVMTGGFLTERIASQRTQTEQRQTLESNGLGSSMSRMSLQSLVCQY